MDKQPNLCTKNLKALSDQVHKAYDNFIVDNINDHCLRMAVMQGAYPWHYHSHTDELFMVLEGELKIEIKNNETVYLQPGQFITIPAGTIHKTSAVVRTVNLTFEKNAADTIFVD